MNLLPLRSTSLWIKARDLTLPLLLLAAAVVHALPEDRDQPIYLEAEGAEFDQRSGRSIYRGNVVLTQGSMGLMADVATISFEDGKLSKMQAEGKPVRFRYRPAVDKEQINGEGLQVEYDVNNATVVVTGNVKFTQGEDVFTGSRVVYDLKNDVVTAGGRVKITLQPRR